MQNKRQSYFFGIFAEYISIVVLLFNFYIPLHRRYKTKFGEIDLIFYKNNTLYFVEVKARNKIDNYENIVSCYQLKRIVNSANYFVAKNKKFQDCSRQFDIIYITLKPPFYRRINNIEIDFMK